MSERGGSGGYGGSSGRSEAARSGSDSLNADLPRDDESRDDDAMSQGDEQQDRSDVGIRGRDTVRSPDAGSR